MVKKEKQTKTRSMINLIGKHNISYDWLHTKPKKLLTHCIRMINMIKLTLKHWKKCLYLDQVLNPVWWYCCWMVVVMACNVILHG